MKKHRMYKLYIIQDFVYGIGFIIPIILFKSAIQCLSLLIEDDFSNFENIIMFLVFTVMGFAFLVWVISLVRNHYKRIDKVRAINPELVHEYEKEFEIAEALGNEIWITNKYCFISDRRDFIVAKPEEIKKIRLYVKYTRRSRYLKLQIIGKDFDAHVQLWHWSLKNEEEKENAIKSAERLRAFSGAEFVNDI